MILSSGKYYLYRHIRNDIGMPFYIGVGTKKKSKSICKTTYTRAFSTKNRTNYWDNIVYKHGYSVEIILESDDKEFILEKEKEFIKLYGRVDLSSGLLVNLNDGGSTPKNVSKCVTDSILKTKKEKGSLCNIKNLANWINSENYKNPKSREIHLYSVDGNHIKSFDSIKKSGDFLNKKGSISDIIEICNKKKVYKNKYIFSWSYEGDIIDTGKYLLHTCFFVPVYKICAKTKNIICRYESMAEAAKSVNVSHKNISEAAIKKNKTGGFYWLKELDIKNKDSIKFSNRTKPVIGISDCNKMVTYDSVFEAELSVGVYKGSISSAIKNGHKCKGFVWRFLNNE